MKKHLFNLAFTLFLMFSSSVMANNGVVEINQACVSIGCFSGDTPGYPVTIDGQAGRSYRLTSDLIVPNKNTTGIIITINYVTIDLNGFSIYESSCGGFVCTATLGTGYGIYSSSDKVGISVKNGNITGMGNHGVNLGNNANVSHLKVSYNGSRGITVFHGSIVDKNIVHNNLLIGIHARYSSIISNNLVYDNQGTCGISVQSGGNIFNNVIKNNGDYAIEFNFGYSSYRANLLMFYDLSPTFGNAGNGIDMGANVCHSVICPTP